MSSSNKFLKSTKSFAHFANKRLTLLVPWWPSAARGGHCWLAVFAFRGAIQFSGVSTTSRSASASQSYPSAALLCAGWPRSPGLGLGPTRKVVGTFLDLHEIDLLGRSSRWFSLLHFGVQRSGRRGERMRRWGRLLTEPAGRGSQESSGLRNA